ncbi:MAG TPA: hypothetical protein VIW03_15600 [Anaeromyxobacter sp.]
MTTAPVETVIAGSRGFALALVAPLAERVGARPRIAADPLRARTLCAGPVALVVVEFLGPDTLRAIKDLVLEGSRVRVVAAVPEAHAAADAPLRALGVDLARWDGTPAAVLAAVERQLVAAARPASSGAGASPRPPSAAPVRAPPAVARPVPAAQPAGASSPPVLARNAAPPPAPRPAGAPPAVRPAPAQAAAAPAPQPKPATAPRVAAPGPPPAAAPPVARGQPAPPPASAASAVRARPAARADEAPAASWPATVPGQAEAADALERAIAGVPPPAASPLAVVAEVVASLSDIERAVLAGGPQPLDPEPMRRAAVMRVRVAAALATVPPDGAVDAGAVSAFLAEIDALLSDVSALAAGAPPEAQPSLEAVRNALVREAIDLSEALQRVSGAGASAEAPASARAAPRRPQARLLSVERQPPVAPPRRYAGWIALAAVVALAGGYHGWRWYQRRASLAARSVGLPKGTTEVPGAPGAPRIVVPATTDEIPDAAEVQRFKAAEEAKGNVVRENGGLIEIVPGAAGATPPPQPKG